MKNLYLFCLVLYPLTAILYLVLCVLNANDTLLGVSFAGYIISLLLSCFPSALINFGYNLPKKTVTVDGILKAIALVYILFFGYYLPKVFSILLLLILFILTVPFMILIYKYLCNNEITVIKLASNKEYIKTSEDKTCINILAMKISVCGSILVVLNSQNLYSLFAILVFIILEAINYSKLYKIVQDLKVNKKRWRLLIIIIILIYTIIIALKLLIDNVGIIIIGTALCYPLLVDSIHNNKHGLNLKIYND